jgi:benzoyl-CoA reductase/2-hydroxyglutaryl-CoA dehydratase subunit BcrC/BadD/HgdB
MAQPVLEQFAKAYHDPATVASDSRAAGYRVVRTVGSDVPLELLVAAGLTPTAILPAVNAPTPRADAIMGDGTLTKRGQSILEQLLAEADQHPLLITHADNELAQVYAALRGLIRRKEIADTPIYLLDLMHQPRDSSRRYNRFRLEGLRDWLSTLGAPQARQMEFSDAFALLRLQRRLLREAGALRQGETAQLSGVHMLHIIGASRIMPHEVHLMLLRDLLKQPDGLPTCPGEAVFVSGVEQTDDIAYSELEGQGYRIIGDEQDWGDRMLVDVPSSEASLDALADPAFATPAGLASPASHCAAACARAVLAGARRIVHFEFQGEESAPWGRKAMQDAALAAGLPFSAIRLERGQVPSGDLAKKLEPEADGEVQPDPPASAEPRPPTARPSQASGGRSKKALSSIASFGSYQREWFAEVRARAQTGEPFAVVNANSPQEMLRALDIPFVTNQWWASIVAAKQQSERYAGLLEAHGYPGDVEAYSAQGLAAGFDLDPSAAPWGGLPVPTDIQAVLGSPATHGLFTSWERETGAFLFLYEKTADPREQTVEQWWDWLPDRWDEAIEKERIDLMTEELHMVVANLEARTGRRFDIGRFAQIMGLVNEQQEYYQRTRDLIARTTPAPVGIVDTMPATMVPQWHRGTIWARDAAKAFYEEVEARVASGQATCPDEKVRLMWIGRGLWSNMGFYQRWEQTHGAVFVWSMYLALAADGYIRRFDRGRDPVRALAARFVTMGDELRLPTWASAWHVREAQTHSVHGAVALSDADPFVIRGLRAAGIPVLALQLDNYEGGEEKMADVDRQITAFIESLN